MPFLAIGAVVALLASIVLGIVRSRSRGEEPGRLLRGIAVSASLAIAAALALAAVPLLWAVLPTMDVDGWQAYALVGALVGLLVFVSMRVMLFGVAETLYRWSCRLPAKSRESLSRRVARGLCLLVGLAAAFVVLFLVVFAASISGLPTWLFFPLIVGILPTYETLIVPWVQYLRAPRLTSRNVRQTEAWLDDLRLQRKLPRFSLRVQEGGGANAFATGGLGAHLVVVGGTLLDRMSASELRGVLAHEIAHVEERHVPRLILPLTIVGATLHLLSVVSFANPLFAKEGLLFVLGGAGLAGVSAALFLFVLPGFFMRRMEFQADRLAVEILGDGRPLADALQKLAELNEQALDAKSWSHPSTQARLDAIRALSPSNGRSAGLIDPAGCQYATKSGDLADASRHGSPGNSCRGRTAAIPDPSATRDGCTPGTVRSAPRRAPA